MLRNPDGLLGSVWSVAFDGTIRFLGAALRAGGSAYVRGSFSLGEPVFGLSDIDLIVVVPDPAPASAGLNRARVLLRWRWISRWLPPLRRLVVLNVYEETPLADAVASTVLTYGLDRPPDRAMPLFYGPPQIDRHIAIRVKPGLYGPTSGWRRVAGRERRPPVRAPVGRDRWLPAWLELQCWWRYAFWASVEEDLYAATDLCVKLVAEPARIWLWLVHGEQQLSRPAALDRMLRVLPEEESAVRLALELRNQLTSSPSPLELVFPYLVRMSSRLAALAERESERSGTTRVRLLWPDPITSPLPLVDWRALAFSRPPVEQFFIHPGSPADPLMVAAAARTETPGEPVPALRALGLLVLPTLDITSRPLIRGALRAVQCSATDPVSFALVAGRLEADYSNLSGWSVADTARRALTEHLGWLTNRTEGEGGHGLAMAFASLRSLLLVESVASEQPQLPLTIPAVAERLAEVAPEARGLVHEAATQHRAWQSGAGEPSPSTVDALAALVERRARTALAGARRA